MTKISAEELLEQLNQVEQELIENTVQSIKEKPVMRHDLETLFLGNQQGLLIAKHRIQVLVELENRKCKKCGDIHSHVIDCSDRMTFNVNVPA